MQKIIGLDIGSYSIKAVEIVNTINSYEITNFYEKQYLLKSYKKRSLEPLEFEPCFTY